MIELKNVSKTYGKGQLRLQALSDISFQLHKGEILGIIGRSGAGKSTLIRCVNLLEIPDQGQVIINNTDITGLKGKKLEEQRKKIGMIFQHFNLLTSRTIFDNIALPMELAGKSKKEIREKVEELLELVGIADKARQYPANLSGGQKQRVAIARALANDPHLLLCDEATSALDPATTKSILELLQRINERLKITILIITHEMEVVKSICHSVAIIDKGKLMVKGTVQEILSDQNHPVIAAFLPEEKDIQLPTDIAKTIKATYTEEGSAVVEIKMPENGTITWIADVASLFNVKVRIIKSAVESFGTLTTGYLIALFEGDNLQIEQALHYLNEKKINIKLKGYASR